jgi:hypothetical protein
MVDAPSRDAIRPGSSQARAQDSLNNCPLIPPVARGLTTGTVDVGARHEKLVETAWVIAARADLALLSADLGGLTAPIDTPCRSLLMHVDAGPGIGPVTLGVLISNPSGEALMPGAAVVDARLDLWVDLAELYLVPGQEFELRYPTRVVGRGLVTSVFPAER